MQESNSSLNNKIMQIVKLANPFKTGNSHGFNINIIHRIMLEYIFRKIKLPIKKIECK